MSERFTVAIFRQTALVGDWPASRTCSRYFRTGVGLAATLGVVPSSRTQPTEEHRMSFPAPDTIIRDWLNERAEAGVVRAKVATDVAYSDGVLTVTIEPEKFVDLGAWNSLNGGYSDSLGDFYATELGWTNKQSVYLREMVTELRVVDSTGTVVETVDTAAYQRKKNPQF